MHVCDVHAQMHAVCSFCTVQVMSRGKVVEFDTPYKLLQNTGSQLYRMVEKTGPEAARELHEMAKKQASS